jgi:hypothetical protein
VFVSRAQIIAAENSQPISDAATNNSSQVARLLVTFWLRQTLHFPETQS